MPENISMDVVGYPVNRGLNKYGEVFGMTREKMLDWLTSKKKVLDIGAGGGMLQKELNILKKHGFSSNVQIIPMDILYGFKSGKDFADYSTHLAFTNLKKPPTKNDVLEINSLFEKSAVGGSFTRLPFANESFDGVLASYSFGIHSESKEQILQAYSEVERVLKKGGEALISVIFDPEKKVFYTLNRSNPVIYSLDELPFPISNIKLDKSVLHEGQNILTNNFLVINK